VADEWVEGMRSHWTAKHADQHVESLEDHVYPALGKKSIEAVPNSDVLDVIAKLLATGKVETARRVRQRLDAVFEYACMKHSVKANPVASAKREINKRINAASKAHPEQSFPCIDAHELPHSARSRRNCHR
jgi:integrase